MKLLIESHMVTISRWYNQQLVISGSLTMTWMCMRTDKRWISHRYSIYFIHCFSVSRFGFGIMWIAFAKFLAMRLTYAVWNDGGMFVCWWWLTTVCDPNCMWLCILVIYYYLSHLFYHITTWRTACMYICFPNRTQMLSQFLYLLHLIRGNM